jgi:hypothetical protein
MALLGWSAGAAAILAWAMAASSLNWRHGLGAVALVACGLAALAGWRRASSGMLAWTGDAWEWRASAPAEAGTPHAVLDLQGWMLVRWQPAHGSVGKRARWLWVERASAPADWFALRRAVYSRARTEAPDGAKPPMAQR